MKNLFIMSLVALSLASAANAESYNNPYAQRQAEQRSVIITNWLGEAIRVRVPSVIVEPRSYNTRKYGTPIGWCRPVRGSGKVGKWLGLNPVQTCNVR